MGRYAAGTAASVGPASRLTLIVEAIYQFDNSTFCREHGLTELLQENNPAAPMIAATDAGKPPGAEPHSPDHVQAPLSPIRLKSPALKRKRASVSRQDGLR